MAERFALRRYQNGKGVSRAQTMCLTRFISMLSLALTFTMDLAMAFTMELTPTLTFTPALASAMA